MLHGTVIRCEDDHQFHFCEVVLTVRVRLTHTAITNWTLAIKDKASVVMHILVTLTGVIRLLLATTLIIYR